MNLAQLIHPEYPHRGFPQRFPHTPSEGHQPGANPSPLVVRTVLRFNPGSTNDPATPREHKAQRGILKPMVLEVLGTRPNLTAQQIADALPQAFSLTSVVSSLNSLAREGKVQLSQHTRPRRWAAVATKGGAK